MPLKKYIPYVFVAMLFSAAGFFAAHTKTLTGVNKHPYYVQPDQNTPKSTDTHLINLSLTEVAYRNGIRELEPFSNLIEAYIAKVKKKHPHLHISYYFRDLDNGIWVGINEKEQFAPASLFKIPIMLAVLKEAETNPAILSASYQYYKRDFVGLDEGDDGFPKEDGKFYTVEELMQQMIIYSDNAATLILLKYIGDDKLAAVEKFLSHNVPQNGKANTNFVRVKDYASVFRILFNCTFLNKELSVKALSLLTRSHYSKGIRSAIPAHIQVAHKYGIRDIELNGGKIKGYQLHHFGIVYYPDKPFVIGIMTRGENEDVSDAVIHDLSDITYREVDRQMKLGSTSHIIP